MMEHRITDLDIYLFNGGTHYEIYNKLGAHLAVEDGVEGVYFAVWAPNAKTVSVVGDFNEWVPLENEMEPIKTSGVYELFIPGVRKGDLYKFAVETKKGDVLYKADPYGNQSQMRPETASVVTDISDYTWSDDRWQADKKRISTLDRPMSIYEVHLGSWKKDENGNNCGFRTYRDIAGELADYVNYMGYTHVEFIGIAEHPFDGSWGYQVTGYYAPTSRYGEAVDFMYLVDYLHKQGIGVILDWVPAHFPKDAHGLGRFDGEAVYEHPDPRKGEHAHWGTYVFNYERPQVKNFLVANALFWLEKFHVDGLRVDAVASMLYLDYGREAGEWVPNRDGGHENYEVIEFLKHLNSIITRRCPGAMMIAEESTAFPKVSRPPEENGLGFTYKWNMGWMHDFLEYMKTDPYFRQYHQNELTFSFSYAFSENYILVLSHDEVVHLKCSMINKMPGELEDKFGNLRAAYGLMMAHPGKKLLFMGQDFAQLREWSEERSLDWFLLDNEPRHRQLNNYVRALLHMYKGHPALYEQDCAEGGFEWINGADAEHNMLTFCRMTKDKKKCLLFHFNFSPVAYEKHRVGALCSGTYRQVFSSDALEFGGSGKYNAGEIQAEDEPWDWKDYSLVFDVPAYGVAAFEFDYVKPPKKRVRAGTKVVSGTKVAKGTKSANSKSGAKKSGNKSSAKTEAADNTI